MTKLARFVQVNVAQRPRPALGIDIGRVLMCPAADDGRPDTSFLTGNEADALATPASPGMWEVVPDLWRRFDGQVWLVSKCGKRIEALTRLWLEHHQFSHRTGIQPDHWRFVRRRPEKADVAFALSLTHFIDDRLDILEHLRVTVPNLGLFGVQNQPIPEWVTHIPNWDALDEVL